MAPGVQPGDTSPWTQQAPVVFFYEVSTQILLRFSSAHALHGFYGSVTARTGGGPTFLLSIFSSLLALIPPLVVAVRYRVSVKVVCKLI